MDGNFFFLLQIGSTRKFIVEGFQRYRDLKTFDVWSCVRAASEKVIKTMRPNLTHGGLQLIYQKMWSIKNKIIS